MKMNTILAQEPILSTICAFLDVQTAARFLCVLKETCYNFSINFFDSKSQRTFFLSGINDTTISVYQLIQKHGLNLALVDAAACHHHQPSVVSMLLKMDADCNTKDTWEDNALIHNSECGCLESVQLLLSFPNIQVDAINESALTALCYAVSNNHNEVAKLLISAKADVNVDTPWGITPLVLATQYGDIEIIQTLLENKASISDSFNDKEEMLHAAKRNSHPGVIDLLLAKFC